MKDKAIVITGVSSGIGNGLAHHYCEKGALVIGSVRKDSDGHDLTQYPNFHKISYDVVDKVGIRDFSEAVRERLGVMPLFALINNAGIAIAGPLECLSDEDFEHQMDVNVMAVRRVTNAMLPLMGQGSRIVNISSVSGLFSSPFTGPYCISKHALESMTDVYRRELAAFGVKVIAIEPGPIKTKIWGKSKGSLDKFFETRYGHLLKHADKIIENAEASALDVSAIQKVCDKALLSDAPKTRYIVHKSKHLFKFFAKFVPDKIADRLVAKTMKGGEKHRIV